MATNKAMPTCIKINGKFSLIFKTVSAPGLGLTKLHLNSVMQSFRDDIQIDKLVYQILSPFRKNRAQRHGWITEN